MPEARPNHRKCRSTEVGATQRRARFIWVTTAGAAVDHAVTPEVVGASVRSASEPMIGLCGERFWAAPIVADPGRPCVPCARRAPIRVFWPTQTASATTSAAAAMTSAEREEWQRTPHAYDMRWSEYCCQKCGLWPGSSIHQTPAGARDPDRAPAGLHKVAS